MSESGDYTPAPWAAGHDFASARKKYLDDASRTYGDAVAKGVTAASLVPETLVCEAENPLVIVCDVTASMAEWPAVIFSKLPYLEHEGKEYLGQDMQISFAAVGDAFSDKYALQVQPFVEGAAMKDAIGKLVHERGGGGTSEESYDLAALYYARNAQFPNAIRKPIIIFIGDEGIYETVNADHGEKLAKAKVGKDATAKGLFQSLAKTCAVYAIRKPYNCTGNTSSPANDRIQNQWCQFLGDDHVVSLPDPNRVVDVIFGILAKESGKDGYFEKELKDRQGKDKDGADKIDVVLNSLRSVRSVKKSVRALPPPSRAKSVSRKKLTGGAGATGMIKLDEDS
jgi:hypothetical protein